TLQHVPQRGTQWRNPSPHRDKNQIASGHLIELEPAPANLEQLKLVTHTHVINNAAGACFLFHKHFKIAICRRSGESKVSRFFTLYTQYRNLPWREINRSLGSKIE